MTPIFRSTAGLRGAGLISAVLLLGCTEYEPLRILPYNPDSPTDTYCTIDTGEIFAGAPRDGIAALTNPRFVRGTHAEADYVEDDYRVVGILAGVDALAIPLNVLWYHEIVNMEAAGHAVAITHCPLTGSSMAFSREGLNDVAFGVSGLLYRNNLIMYDRTDPESLWPQMLRGARCGAKAGAQLPMYPIVETTWSAWLDMHPDTWVLSSETGYDFRYYVSPYGDYDINEEVSWPTEIDRRRHPKERTLGVVGTSGSVGYPFVDLAALGPVAVVEHVGATSAPGGAVIFWDEAAAAAMAYSRRVDAAELTFSVVGDEIVDAETGSVWRVDGVSTEGPLAGRALDPIPEAYIAFWFAWAGFHPGTTLWEAP